MTYSDGEPPRWSCGLAGGCRGPAHSERGAARGADVERLRGRARLFTTAFRPAPARCRSGGRPMPTGGPRNDVPTGRTLSPAGEATSDRPRAEFPRREGGSDMAGAPAADRGSGSPCGRRCAALRPPDGGRSPCRQRPRSRGLDRTHLLRRFASPLRSVRSPRVIVRLACASLRLRSHCADRPRDGGPEAEAARSGADRDSDSNWTSGACRLRLPSVNLLYLSRLELELELEPHP